MKGPTQPAGVLKSDDHVALRSLIAELRPLLIARAMAVLHDTARAEDVVQEVTLKLWQRRAELPHEDDALRGYFSRSVTNAAINELRGHTRRRRTEKLAAKQEGSRLQVNEDALEAWEVVTGLPSIQREVIELRYLEGLTISEAATRLGVPEGTVNSRQRQGLQNLRTQLVSAGMSVISVTAVAALLGSIATPAKAATGGAAAGVLVKAGGTGATWLKPLLISVGAIAIAAAVTVAAFQLSGVPPDTPANKLQPVAQSPVNAPTEASVQPLEDAVAVVQPLLGAYIETMQHGGRADLDQLDVHGFDFVVHGFLGVSKDGQLTPLGHFNEYQQAGALASLLKSQGARPMVSVGGVGSGESFGQLVHNQRALDEFVQNVADFLANSGNRGIEVNWQFPEASQKDDFTKLMVALYNGLKNADADYKVNFAAGSGYWFDSYDWRALNECSDYAIITGYGWNNPAGGPMRNPGVELATQSGRKIEASVGGAIGAVIAGGYPAERVICVLPAFSSKNESWHTERDGWEIGSPWRLHEHYLEPRIMGSWWTTPESISAKLNALLHPEYSALAGGKVIGGVSLWELGHEDPTRPDLSAALKQWAKQQGYD